jgi:RNA polymerase sigma-70 factor, ECF subfamily
LENRDERESHILWLYDNYAAQLQNYAVSLVRNEALAQDAVQEVFLRYALLIHEGGSVSMPKAWLFRVLRNYVFDGMRAAQVRNEVGIDCMPDRADENLDPEQQYASAELTCRILDALTPRERDCLRLRSHGLRYAEIASVLSIRPGTVATLLFRCNARIQEMLDSQSDVRPLPIQAKGPYAS